jgi:hypothetical protein
VQTSPADAGAAPQRGLLPDFCSLPMALGVVLYGELLAILLTLASPSPLAVSGSGSARCRCWCW